ncbi:YheC/YheD family protein [Cytobacillus depressus]|uniref:YheC/YheD family protein n=1 Tax=Cytobacillus depressus TaxID=1602942 RepID=UPI001478430C|nr:YheC/YheD family protein [Cytobacillus depressus]
MNVSYGKWTNHKTLILDDQLKEFLPETMLLTEDNFWRLMDRHQQVIVKPNMGRFGNGLLKIKTIDTGLYEFRSNMLKTIIHGRMETYKAVNSNLISRKNIVQQAIDLAKINDFPFDLRIMVQRKKKVASWVVTGKAAKVACEGYFITNIAQKVMIVQDALDNSNIENINPNELIKRIEAITQLTAARLSSIYPGHRIFGLDIGIDKSGEIWIFEANYAPSLAIFRLLGDKKTLRKIKRFKRH